jgi:choice-of-anchor A domain-containing protein
MLNFAQTYLQMLSTGTFGTHMKKSAYALCLAAGLLAGPMAAQTLQPTAPMHGFSVFVKQDVNIKSGHLAGGLAVGGNASFDADVRIAQGGSSQYFSPAEQAPLGLLIGGELVFKYAADVTVSGNCAVKIANLGENQVIAAPQKTRRLSSGDGQNAPKLTLPLPQTAADLRAMPALSVEASFRDLTKTSEQLSNMKPNAAVTITEKRASISLTNQTVNVWNIKMEDLATLQSLHFEQSPTVTSPLIINVFGHSGEAAWSTPPTSGLTATSSLFVLYNFVQVSELVLRLNHPLLGTVYAPNTVLVLCGKEKLEGQIAAEALFLYGTTIADRPFSSLVPALFAADERSASTLLPTLEEGQTSLFPNPTKELLHIRSMEKDIHTALIYNTMGQLVQETLLESMTISVRDLPVGTYYLHVVGREGRKVATLAFQRGE